MWLCLTESNPEHRGYCLAGAPKWAQDLWSKRTCCKETGSEIYPLVQARLKIVGRINEGDFAPHFTLRSRSRERLHIAMRLLLSAYSAGRRLPCLVRVCPHAAQIAAGHVVGDSASCCAPPRPLPLQRSRASALMYCRSAAEAASPAVCVPTCCSVLPEQHHRPPPEASAPVPAAR